jgi:hypothetical protein
MASALIGVRAIWVCPGWAGPIRFVNQLESGTSSIVLTFYARVPDGL